MAAWTRLVVDAEFLRDEELVRDAAARTALRGGAAFAGDQPGRPDLGNVCSL
jgi:hypothetical protein